MSKVAALREEVVTYTLMHAELSEAHHYDFALMLNGRADYFVMGLNPGETAEDRCLHPGRGHLNPYGNPAGPFSMSAKRWYKRSERLLDTPNILYGDFFFWSSHNIGNAFIERFGTTLEASPHLPFCRRMIGALLAMYTPKAVIIPGLKLCSIVPSLYDLKQVATIPQGTKRLIEHYTDGARPWLFIKHFSARPTRAETEAAKRYVENLESR
jgi:hypothetical protein